MQSIFLGIQKIKKDQLKRGCASHSQSPSFAMDYVKIQKDGRCWLWLCEA